MEKRQCTLSAPRVSHSFSLASPHQLRNQKSFKHQAFASAPSSSLPDTAMRLKEWRNKELTDSLSPADTVTHCTEVSIHGSGLCR